MNQRRFAWSRACATGITLRMLTALLQDVHLLGESAVRPSNPPEQSIAHPVMTAHSFALPVIIFTTFWGLIGIAGPWFVPKGPNRG